MPEISSRCGISGGTWYSYYDDVTVDHARGLDIDHMVPLAEAWDSGAYDWSPKHRESSVNDLGEPRALVAVTARSNRSKSYQDPATWLPWHEQARCAYIVDWVTVKTRWNQPHRGSSRAACAARSRSRLSDRVDHHHGSGKTEQHGESAFGYLGEHLDDVVASDLSQRFVPGSPAL